MTLRDDARSLPRASTAAEASGASLVATSAAVPEPVPHEDPQYPGPWRRREQIGLATLYLGDCREIAPTLPRPAAVISDPPYGMKASVDSSRFSGGNTRRGIGKDYGSPIVGDDKPFDPAPWIDHERVILWGLNHFPYGLKTGSALVWVKRSDGAFGTFLSDAELAWKKGGCGVYCFRDTDYKTAEREHPTQKPVALMRWCIEQAKVPPGGVILDPYAGSGSTIVAAVQMRHPAIGIEIEERYFDVMCKRVTEAQRQFDLFRDAEQESAA